MNAERRKRIAAIRDQLDTIAVEVESLRDAEQEAFDNLPEGLQQSERGQASESAASTLDELASALADGINGLEGIE